MESKTILNFDGGIKGGNPGGLPTYGWIMAQDGAVIATGYGVADGPRTNNVAEYAGLIAGLKALAEKGISKAEVRGDSEMVIFQMTGRYRCRKEHLIPLWEEARSLAAEHTFRWVPREQNAAADKLAFKAWQEAKSTESVLLP